MIIWLLILTLAPGISAMGYFYHITERKHTIGGVITISIMFILVINTLSLITIWLRGHASLNWSLDSSSCLTSLTFCVKYLLISIFFSVLLPWSFALLGKIKLPVKEK